MIIANECLDRPGLTWLLERMRDDPGVEVYVFADSVAAVHRMRQITADMHDARPSMSHAHSSNRFAVKASPTTSEEHRMAEGDWQDKVVVVTGAAGGIGSALSRCYTAAGARVALVGRTGGSVAALAHELDPSRSQVSHHAVDVSNENDVGRVFAEVHSAWGAVDVMINNAAFADEASLIDTTPERWDAQVGTALRGAYLCARAVLPGMRERGRGVILNISSVNARLYVGNEAYSAAKAGLDSLTRSIAVRYGRDGIRAVGIGAGTILTPGAWDARIQRDPDILARVGRWYPAGRLGRPDDVVHLAAFVTSPQAGWITGTTVMLDGGLTAGNPLMAADILSEP